jgi:hypothetical protein
MSVKPRPNFFFVTATVERESITFRFLVEDRLGRMDTEISADVLKAVHPAKLKPAVQERLRRANTAQIIARGRAKIEEMMGSGKFDKLKDREITSDAMPEGMRIWLIPER